MHVTRNKTPEPAPQPPTNVSPPPPSSPPAPVPEKPKKQEERDYSYVLATEVSFGRKKVLEESGVYLTGSYDFASWQEKEDRLMAVKLKELKATGAARVECRATVATEGKGFNQTTRSACILEQKSNANVHQILHPAAPATPNKLHHVRLLAPLLQPFVHSGHRQSIQCLQPGADEPIQALLQALFQTFFQPLFETLLIFAILNMEGLQLWSRMRQSGLSDQCSIGKASVTGLLH
jgi:hypothetical protein